MSTSLTQLMSALSEPKLEKFWLNYFRENFRGEINDLLIELFKSAALSKADIARKLDRRPEQITRWLSAPNNLESDTISDIALSLGCVPKIRFERVGEDTSNCRQHEFISVIENASISDSVAISAGVATNGVSVNLKSNYTAHEQVYAKQF